MSHTESVIVDVTQFDDWPRQYGRPFVPPDKRPTIIQCDRETADQEAVRLAQAHPGHRFAVFTIVGIVETKEVPTHITIGGRIAAVTSKPVWSERDL